MPQQMTVHLCLSCGLPFEVTLSEVKRGSGKYCSNRCVGDANRGTHKIDYVCDHCGITFQSYPSLKNRAKIFCSRTCTGLAIRIPLHARFWKHVQRCEHEDLCPYCCWPWQGKRRRLGYGMIASLGKEFLAHRQSWALHHGVDYPPSSLVIRHLCNYPPCCNPAHLMSGTVLDNARDRVRSGHSLKGEQSPFAKLTAEEVQTIYALRQQGVTADIIAATYGVSSGTILAISTHRNWRHLVPVDATPVRGSKRGNQHPKARLTASDIPTIRALYAEGQNCVAIGRMYNVSDETIRMVIRGITWRHVL